MSTKKSKRRKPTVIDLFCGAGGLSCGFERAGYRILLGLDSDSKALETFERNHNGAKSICGDITKISYEEDIKPIVGNKPIDVIVGGPPCQGMSLSGPRKFDDPRNRLYLSYIRLVAEIRPKVFVIEKLFGGKIKDSIIDKLHGLGYCMKFKILSSDDYGVPQHRRRVVFVGVRNDIGIEFEYPMPSPRKVTCRMALSDLPALETTCGDDRMDYISTPQNHFQKVMRAHSDAVRNHIAAHHSRRVRDIIALVPDGGNYKDLPGELRNSRNFHVAWTRFAADKPAPTIDTGHRHHFHYLYNRVPTVRECARLQSFPDDFVFIGNKTQQFRQVGNAVPPLMAQAIADKLLKVLESK